MHGLGKAIWEVIFRYDPYRRGVMSNHAWTAIMSGMENHIWDGQATNLMFLFLSYSSLNLFFSPQFNLIRVSST